MVGTKVIAAARLPESVFVYSAPEEIAGEAFAARFSAHEVIVIDGIEWPGIEKVRRGLSKAHRRFKDPFHGVVSKDTQAGMELVVSAAEELVARLLPGHRLTDRCSSLRPLVTGPEPMHFDTFSESKPVLTCFINVADTPRIYRIGPTFKHLMQTQPEKMREVAATANKKHNVSYRIRDLTVEGKPPLPADCDAHRVEFAPGAIWFFNAKTVSHEVVHGEGAIGIGWTMPDSGALSQDQLIMEC